ncbi:MAG: hypothetical protein JXR50_01015 [Prolixibacteraceae bacterium]|nr:hypothetical protein [Prolixibacteraceae bacterium]MBN2648301.1 hypothetical protein [Prolixibacteraceae bacterium]
MKSISLLALFCIFSFFTSQAQHSFQKSGLAPGATSSINQQLSDPGEIQITHSPSNVIMSANSVSCNAGNLHADNSYFRIFDLANDFSITSNFLINRLEIGIETASGSSGSQPIVANFYTLDGSFNWSNLTLLYTETFSVSDQTLSLFEMQLTEPVLVTSEKILVVEIFTPDGQSIGNSFFIGSNNSGESSPSYLSAGDCAISEPTTFTSIGFPGVNVVMNLYGESSTVPFPYVYIAGLFLLIAGWIIFRKLFLNN